VFDYDCFAETLKKAMLGPLLVVEVFLAKDLQLMQSARSKKGFLIPEAPGRSPKTRKSNQHALGLFSLSVWLTGISAKSLQPPRSKHCTGPAWE